MRQVGDRLIPVGVTSGRIHPIGQELPSASGDVTPDEPGSRSRRRRGNPSATGQAIDITQFLGLNGQDIEEVRIPMKRASHGSTHPIAYGDGSDAFILARARGGSAEANTRRKWWRGELNSTSTQQHTSGCCCCTGDESVVICSTNPREPGICRIAIAVQWKLLAFQDTCRLSPDSIRFQHCTWSRSSFVNAKPEPGTRVTG
jgi:hypothetical protein